MNALIAFLMIIAPGLAVYLVYQALRMTGRTIGYVVRWAARLVRHEMLMRPQCRYFVG